MKPQLHLLGIFHTQHTAENSHCAFTGKALRFPKMMQKYGYKVIEYSNEGSESGADELVTMMSSNEYAKLYHKRKKTDFFGNDAVIGSEGHQLFESRLIPALRKRLKPKDIICHPFGHVHQILMTEFPHHQHIETGIGYPILMPNSFRIFESYAWMHFHQGKENRNGKNYEWVVPNYYDLDDWEPRYEKGQYYAFLGRIDAIKGMDTLRAIADYIDHPIVLHGQGDPSNWKHPKIEYRGPIHGKARSEFLRNAKALLAPSLFTEPFCGMAVEAMLCGTPVISVNYGAMTETVEEGMGFRCHTLQDWLDAIDAVDSLDRKFIADRARSKYSLEACGKKYDKIFMDLNNLYGKGWYEVSYKHMDKVINPYSTHLPTLKNIFKNNKIESIFEFGTGLYSTPLFCKESKNVIAVEMQDYNWFIKVKNELKEFSNLEIHSMLGPTDAIEYFRNTDKFFDLVFVDGHGDSRPECINAAFNKAKIIVTHDFEEPCYKWERIKQQKNYELKVYKDLCPWTAVWTKID